jgi:hypothetical protein
MGICLHFLKQYNISIDLYFSENTSEHDECCWEALPQTGSVKVIKHR